MKNHHQILQIILGSKFQPQQTVFNFWNKFTPKKNSSGQKFKK